MKTVIVYSLNRSGSYDGLFSEVLREGRARGWRFAFVEPVSLPQAEENARVERMLKVLRPAGFVGCHVADTGHVNLPGDLPQVWLDCHHAHNSYRYKVCVLQRAHL